MTRDLRNNVYFWIAVMAVYFAVAVVLSFLVRWFIGLVMIGVMIIAIITVMIFDKNKGT